MRRPWGRHESPFIERRPIADGRKGELCHRYERGPENQLGALGLVLNRVTLWMRVYLDAAVRRPKAQGHPVNISRLVGRKETVVMEKAYRRQLRPVLLEGAEAMDMIFPDGARGA
ncbi:Tn3 family transposase [Streptosporangium sp. NPDC048865]|uniref:Tn3 family transposase n=1 Tax=Streptosporangium sp. NPDC048865 TaxID=3155766 RepID=UPI003429E949